MTLPVELFPGCCVEDPTSPVVLLSAAELDDDAVSLVPGPVGREKLDEVRLLVALLLEVEEGIEVCDPVDSFDVLVPLIAEIELLLVISDTVAEDVACVSPDEVAVALEDETTPVIEGVAVLAPVSMLLTQVSLPPYPRKQIDGTALDPSIASPVTEIELVPVGPVMEVELPTEMDGPLVVPEPAGTVSDDAAVGAVGPFSVDPVPAPPEETSAELVGNESVELVD